MAGKPKALLFDLGASVTFGRLPLPAKVLWVMLLIRSDDQGRGLAESDVVKWKVCPNVTELTPEVIEESLAGMAEEPLDLLTLYRDSRDRLLYQVNRWWEPEVGSGSCLQWARPSEYDPPEGWTDRIRQQRGPGRKPLVTNWDHPGGYRIAEIEPTEDLATTLSLANGLAKDVASGQNNLTKPNITEPNKEGAGSSGDKPPAPKPKPKPKPPHWTEGQRAILKAWGNVRFRTNAQAEEVLELEQKYGTAKLVEAGRWAATKGMSLGDGIISIKTALPDWGKAKPKRKGGTDERERKTDTAEAEAIRAQLRRGD